MNLEITYSDICCSIHRFPDCSHFHLDISFLWNLRRNHLLSHFAVPGNWVAQRLPGGVSMTFSLATEWDLIRKRFYFLHCVKGQFDSLHHSPNS